MSQYFIIEGPDCVGKSTFINRFMQYLQRPLYTPHKPEGAAGTRRARAEAKRVIKSGKANKRFETIVDAEVYLNYLNDELKERETIREPFSAVVATVARATTENAEFNRQIHAGELDQEQIAQGYLQVNYDHHNAALILGKSYDMVLMDRGLPSYYALQLTAMGLNHHRPNWMKLLKLTQQNQFTLVYLKADEEVILERAKAKKGVSVLDDIYGERITSVIAGYEELIEEGLFKDVLVVDANKTKLKDFIVYFESMIDRARYSDPAVRNAIALSRGLPVASLGAVADL